MSCDHLTQEYTGIDLSWRQRHLQMTPLFAATQASQSVAVEQSVGAASVGVALRATQQGLAFTPTQGTVGKLTLNDSPMRSNRLEN